MVTRLSNLTSWAMRTSFTSVWGLVFLMHPLHAQTEVQPIPKELAYFNEQKYYPFSHASELRIQAMAKKQNLHLFKKLPLSRLDALIVNQSLEKAILLSTNHRTNPEFLNQVYKHEDGYLLHMKIRNEQLALFFIQFSEREILQIQNDLLSENHAKQLWQLLFPFSYAAELSPSDRPAPNTRATSTELEKIGTILPLLFDYSKGCFFGLLELANNIARTPFDVVSTVHTVARNTAKDPSSFWRNEAREYQQFKNEFRRLMELMPNLWQVLSAKFKEFSTSSLEQQAKVLCEYILPRVAGSTAVVTHVARNKTHLPRQNVNASPSVRYSPFTSQEEALKGFGLKDHRAQPGVITTQSGVPYYTFDRSNGVLKASIQGVDSAFPNEWALWQAATKNFRTVVKTPNGQGYVIWYDTKGSAVTKHEMAFFKTAEEAEAFLRALPPPSRK